MVHTILLSPPENTISLKSRTKTEVIPNLTNLIFDAFVEVLESTQITKTFNKHEVYSSQGKLKQQKALSLFQLLSVCLLLLELFIYRRSGASITGLAKFWVACMFLSANWSAGEPMVRIRSNLADFCSLCSFEWDGMHRSTGREREVKKLRNPVLWWSGAAYLKNEAHSHRCSFCFTRPYARQRGM